MLFNKYGHKSRIKLWSRFFRNHCTLPHPAASAHGPCCLTGCRWGNGGWRNWRNNHGMRGEGWMYHNGESRPFYPVNKREKKFVGIQKLIRQLKWSIQFLSTAKNEVALRAFLYRFQQYHIRWTFYVAFKLLICKNCKTKILYNFFYNEITDMVG